MNADGTIPHERIPLSINRYDVSALPSKSQTYDFSDGVSKFVASNRSSVEVQDGVQLINIAANAGNAGQHGRADLDISGLTTTATEIIVEYDVFYDGGRWDIGFVNTAQRPGSSAGTTYDTAGVAFYTGMTDSLNNFYINGVNQYDTTLNNTWYHVKVDINMTAKTVAYTISVGNEVKFDGTAEIPDGISVVNGIEVYSWTQGTIKFDNIKINALYDVDENGLYVTGEGQYIYKDGEPVRVGFDDLSGYYTKDEIDGKLETEEGGFQGGTSAQVMAGGAVGKEAIAENGAAVGYGAESMDGSATGSGAVTDAGGAAGSGANSLDGGAVGNTAQTDDGGAVGKNAQSSYGGAVGSGAKTGDGFAGGYEAKTTDSAGESIDAIQLGTGTNEIPKTLQIYDYRLMNADGTIPSERLSGYYTKDEIDEATTELSNSISDKIGKNDEVSVEISSGGIVDVTSTAWEALKSGLRADELLSTKADKDDVYTKTQIDTKLGDKADKPAITSVSAATPSVTLTDNTETRCGAVTLLALTLPSSTGDDYISAVVFTANSDTPLSYPDTIVMVGTDCIDGVFAPVSGKRYEVIVTNDGASYVGRVSGYEVTA